MIATGVRHTGMTEGSVHGLGLPSQHGSDRWASFVKLRPAWPRQGLRGAVQQVCRHGAWPKMVKQSGALMGKKCMQVG